jgi:hypothetical protein
MSQDYTEWRGKVDMAIQGLNKLVADVRAEIGVIKTGMAGLQMTIEAQAGVNDNLLQDIIKLEKKIGEGVLVAPLERIAKALESGGGSPFKLPKKDRVEPPPRQSKPASRKGDPVEVDADTADLAWKIKGNSEARDSDPFAYAFVYTNREQTEVRSNVRELLELCEEHGTILTTDGFLVKLGGTNNSLLNRNIPKRG